MANANLSVPSDSATNPATICLLSVIGLAVIFYTIYRYGKGSLYTPVITATPARTDAPMPETPNCYSIRTVTPDGTFDWVPIGSRFFNRVGV